MPTGMTSRPMPSPAITAILCVFAIEVVEPKDRDQRRREPAKSAPQRTSKTDETIQSVLCLAIFENGSKNHLYAHRHCTWLRGSALRGVLGQVQAGRRFGQRRQADRCCRSP